MREPRAVFICLRRLKQISEEAHAWLLDDESLDWDEECADELLKILSGDVIMYGRLLMYRRNKLSWVVYDLDDGTFTEDGYADYKELCDKINAANPSNPLK